MDEPVYDPSKIAALKGIGRTEVPPLPSYRDLADRTWMQLRECTFLAMTALAHLTQDDDTGMARTTLLTMDRILSPDWDGQIIDTDKDREGNA